TQAALCSCITHRAIPHLPSFPTRRSSDLYTAKDSEFHRVTCFNGLAQTVGKFCTKGQLVSVQGRLHYTQWEDQEGVKRYGCEVRSEEHTSELQSRENLVCRLLLEKKKTTH